MDALRWQQIERVLDIALASDPAAWPGIVNDHCSGDPELQEDVEALLARLETAQDFLDSPPAALAAAFVAGAREAADGDRYLGCRIGVYRILRQIGLGGMARVYLAERADGQFEQKVAVKLLRPGLDSDVDLQRFRRERQILASLNHSGIARLLDGGITPEGIPFLVMEHVEGEPIDVYCARHSLTVRRRLKLFGTILEATQYAHRNRVVHCDIKPSNIFVTADGAVRLLDFGLAKLLDAGADLPGKSTRTEQRWMTPEYAAPEQVRGEPATTLTDVYQLGVVLFEILTGSLPFGRRGASLHALESAILGEDPPLASAIAQSRALAGDIDAILAVALHKRPERRYSSASEFAEDLRRHLSGHPVRARRPTPLYRVRRFVRRNVVGVAAGAVIALLAGAWVGTVVIERTRVEGALAEARRGTQRAEQVTDFMLSLFEASEGGRALTDTVTAHALLSRALAEARELSAQPEMQAQMLDVIGRLHTELGNYAEARPLLDEALVLRRRLYGNEHPDVATTLENLAAAAVGQDDVAETLRLRREALELRRRVSGAGDPRTVSALYGLGFALHQAGDVAAANVLFDEWLVLIDAVPERSAQRARQLASAAAILRHRGDAVKGESLNRQALEMRRAVLGDDHHLVASSVIDLALVLHDQRRFAEAEALLAEAASTLRRSFPDGHPLLANALNYHGLVLSRLRRYHDAIGKLRESIVINSRLVGENSLAVANVYTTLADALVWTGAPEEAESVAREAMRIYVAELGPQNSMVLFAQAHVGDAVRAQGRYDEAERLLLESYRRFETPRPITARWRRYTLACLVRLYEGQGREADAAPYRQLLEQAISSAGGAARAVTAPH